MNKNLEKTTNKEQELEEILIHSMSCRKKSIIRYIQKHFDDYKEESIQMIEDMYKDFLENIDNRLEDKNIKEVTSSCKTMYAFDLVFNIYLNIISLYDEYDFDYEEIKRIAHEYIYWRYNR